MKKLTISLVLACVVIYGMACGINAIASKVSGQEYHTIMDISSEEWEEDWDWDTLCTHDGKTYRLIHSMNMDDVRLGIDVQIISYRDRIPLDTCILKGGWGEVITDSGKLKLTVGLDTISYNLASLPKIIYPIRELLPDSVQDHSLRLTFPLENSDWLCRFDYEVYLANDYPKWLNHFMAALIGTDLQEQLIEDQQEQDYIRMYQEIMANPRIFEGFDVSSAAPVEIGRYFARRFESLYNGMYGDWGNITWAAPYEYSIQVAPEWTSEDGRLTTYRFFNQTYGGGAHGMMEEYFLTFETSTGRLLGYQDMFDDVEFEKEMVELGRALDLRRHGEVDLKDGERAYIEFYKNSKDTLTRLLYESYKGHLYPRPGLLGDRVVFSYQPYDKGSFAEGIMHFVIHCSIVQVNSTYESHD